MRAQRQDGHAKDLERVINDHGRLAFEGIGLQLVACVREHRVLQNLGHALAYRRGYVALVVHGLDDGALQRIAQRDADELNLVVGNHAVRLGERRAKQGEVTLELRPEGAVQRLGIAYVGAAQGVAHGV